MISASVWVMLAVAIILLAYMSFVEEFTFAPSLRAITTFGLVSMLLSISLWESFYDSAYTKELNADIQNEEYSIHKRYYFARKGWKYIDLQNCVRQYNKDYREAWLRDVEDITGRTIDDIRNGGYKKQNHKILIWRIKHGKYPTTGIKVASSLLYVLSVGKSYGMKMDVQESEKYHAKMLTGKIFSSLALSFLAASFTYQFITGDYLSAILRLTITLTMTCFSVLLGAKTGYKAARTKLSTAEAVSEKLEEWRGTIPTEVPYKEESDIKNVLETDELEKPIEDESSTYSNVLEIV